MKYLIYYKIRVNGVLIENNDFIETEHEKPSYSEIKKFYCDMRDKHETSSRPIIINMFELC